MTDETSRPLIRRVTVTLDVRQPEAAELDRSVRLAARLGAELEGVFIEDEDLLHVSTLPFARELHMSSLGSEALSVSRIERELRVLARRAERALQEQAERAGVRCSFRVWRGELGAGLLAEFAGADVLALGQLGVCLVPRRRAPIEQARAIAVIADATDVGLRALDTAIELARDSASPLVVILADTETASSAAVRARLEDRRLSVSTVNGAAIDPAAVRAVVDRFRSPVLILPNDYPYLATIPLRQLISALGCHLLLVR